MLLQEIALPSAVMHVQAVAAVHAVDRYARAMPLELHAACTVALVEATPSPEEALDPGGWRSACHAASDQQLCVRIACVHCSHLTLARMRGAFAWVFS